MSRRGQTYTRAWSTSERRYDVTVDRDVTVRMPDGTTLDGDVWRPAASGRFPVLLGAHPYGKNLQSPPMTPKGTQQKAVDLNTTVDPSFAEQAVKVLGGPYK